MNLRFTMIAMLLTMCGNLFAKDNAKVSIEPPFWWTGMVNPQVQLMVNAPDIRDAEPSINYAGLSIDSVVRLESPNYQLIYVNVAPETVPGKFAISFKNGKKTTKVNYELRKRDGEMPKTFDSSDVLYLIMPDRFANGDTKNDAVKGMNYIDAVDRSNPSGRHGGDLKGIENHLGYIDSLGVTAIWLNPVLENDMPGGSYHGYATTNYYKIDPRLGTNDQYKELISSTHKRGMKVIMDMIFNHCGVAHPWLKDLPSKDWLNHPNGDLMTNFRLTTLNDPYASSYDKECTVKGWFVPAMPDLNQLNPHLMKYLIQNSIWWVEYSKIDGIRMDTYPYAEADKMAEWIAAVQKEYPGYNIVGECWYSDGAGTAYWQKGNRLNDNDTNLPTVMDFPLMLMSNKAFFGDTKEYDKGLNNIYDRLAQDYLYKDVKHLLTFLDNHDTDRFLLTDPKDLKSWKQAVAFLLTSRGIPQLYYGTEILMSGDKSVTDGNVRKDMPGGFPGDKVNTFVPQGRTDLQNEAFDFISKLAHWRRGNDVIANGTLKHFTPRNGVYVYQRSKDDKKVTVIMNGSDSETTLDMKPYAEFISAGETLTDVITGEKVTITPSMTFAPRALFVLE